MLRARGPVGPWARSVGGRSAPDLVAQARGPVGPWAQSTIFFSPDEKCELVFSGQKVRKFFSPAAPGFSFRSLL